MNATSGELLVRGPIDYEQYSEYLLVVIAHDGVGLSGVVRLSSRVQVTVRVTDINDCAPYIVVNSLSPHGFAEVILDLLSFVIYLLYESYTKYKQVAQLSQRDRAAGWVSNGQKWKTRTERQYLRTI